MAQTSVKSQTSKSASAKTSYEKWYAGGKWLDAPALFDDFEPYTGELFSRAPDCGPQEAKVAVKAANDAFPIWANMPPVEKARL